MRKTHKQAPMLLSPSPLKALRACPESLEGERGIKGVRVPLGGGGPYPRPNSGITSCAIRPGISAVTSSGPEGLKMKCSTPASRYSPILSTI